jgi:predicted nucleic acid-binding protein
MLDANVLVYAEDSHAGAKSVRAAEVISLLVGRGQAVVTPQILGEYWLTTTRKLARPLPEDAAETRVREFRNYMRVLPYDGVVVAEAIRGARRYGFHYWDSQIWAASRLSGVEVVLSEDFSSGTEIEGVRFVNPFAEDFDLDALLAG